MNSKFCIETDQRLVSGLAAGDRGAQQEVFRLFEVPAYNLAMKICQDTDVALEVLQDGMIQVFEKSPGFRGESPFWGWLRQIIVNTALGHLRKKNRWLRTFDFDNGRETESTQRDLPGQIDLGSALARLPANNRAVLWLYEVEGFSHAEIASMMGRSISFSKSQLSRAKVRMRNYLGLNEEADTCPAIISQI